MSYSKTNLEALRTHLATTDDESVYIQVNRKALADLVEYVSTERNGGVWISELAHRKLVSEMQAEIQFLVKERNDYRSKLSDATNGGRIEELEIQTDDLQKQLRFAINRAEDAEGHYDQFKDEISSLTQNLQMVTKDRDDWKWFSEMAHNTTQALSGSLLADRAPTSEVLASEVVDLKKYLQTAMKDRDGWKAASEANGDAIKKLVKDLREMTAQRDMLRDQIKNSVLASECEDLTSDLLKARATVSRLQAVINRILHSNSPYMRDLIKKYVAESHEPKQHWKASPEADAYNIAKTKLLSAHPEAKTEIDIRICPSCQAEPLEVGQTLCPDCRE